MNKLPEWLDLNLPSAPNLDLPSPILSDKERDAFLTAMHEEAVRTGAYGWPDSPLRQPFPGKFVIID